MIRAALVAILLALALLVGAGVAGASEGTLVGIRPAQVGESWAQMTVSPEGERRGRAVVENRTDDPQSVVLGTVDATTTADGTFTLAGDDEPAEGVGAWTTLQTPRIELAPGTQRTVDFRVSVPEDAEPGDYAGGLVARADEPAPHREGGGAGAFTVNVLERVGLRIYVSVPGERDGTVVVDDLTVSTGGGSAPRAALGLPSRVDASFTVRHAGNVRYDDLNGSVELRRGDDLVAARPLAIGTLLPGGERPVALRLPLPTLSPGDWTMRVRLDAAQPVVVETDLVVQSLRIWLGLCLALALAGLLVAALWWRRSRRSDAQA